MRTNAPQVMGDFRDGFGWIDLIEITVNVVKETDFTDTKLARGVEQFGLAHFAKRFQARIVFFIAEPAAFATRRGNEIGLDSFSGVFRQSPARPQRFIVRVGKDAHHAQRIVHINLFMKRGRRCAANCASPTHRWGGLLLPIIPPVGSANVG